jgi:hypothetical protein
LAWEVVQSLLTDGEPYKRTIMPSKSVLQKDHAKVNVKANKLIPLFVTHGVDGFQFDFEALLRFIFKHHGLSEIAELMSVEITIMVDGAELHKSVSHIMCGIKLVDKCTLDPLTGELLLNLPESTI